MDKYYFELYLLRGKTQRDEASGARTNNEIEKALYWQSAT